jgi:hypothetical protein
MSQSGSSDINIKTSQNGIPPVSAGSSRLYTRRACNVFEGCACMDLPLFRSAKEPGLFAFVPDPMGRSLPEELGPWVASSEGVSAHAYPRQDPVAVAPFDPVTKAFDRYGFYLVRMPTAYSEMRTAASPGRRG